MHSESALTPQQAQALLATFTCDEPKPIASNELRSQVEAAIQQLITCSDYQMLGILADHYDEAWSAMQHYTQALNYEQPDAPPRLEGPIYLKFNGISGLCTSDRYQGEHRGVLISYQSNAADDLNEMYGHFPLTLFAPN